MKHTGWRTAAIAVCILFICSHSYAQADGYLSSYSVKQGEKLRFYISTSLPAFDLTIYKLGLFKKEIITIHDIAGGIQPVNDSAFINGCNWKQSAELLVPLTWQSGVYEADFPSADSMKKLIFIVKEATPARHSKTLVCLTVNTWQAYNNWGGRSLYDFNSFAQTASKKISFNRPLSDTAASYYYRWADRLVRWLEAHHFDAEFCTNIDLDADPYLLSYYKTYVTVGHDEYWSRPERNEVENFLKSGGRFICLSGNTCWWQVRFEDSLGTMVCFRDTLSDPMYPRRDTVVTSVWGRSPVNDPPNSFLGVSFEQGGFINDDGIFPQYRGYGAYTVFNSQHWIYNGTGVKDGDVIGQVDAIAGYECDGTYFQWNTGFPVPTGEDNTSKNFSILGISLAASSGNLPYGHAVMGYCQTESGGAIFNGGSTDWVRGLDWDDSVQNQMLFNIFWHFTSGLALPPQIITFSPVRTTHDSINHEWVNINHQSRTYLPNATDTFTIHAFSPEGKKIFYTWFLNGGPVGFDSVFILTPQLKKTLPPGFTVEGSVANNFMSNSVTWSLIDTTLRFVSTPVSNCKGNAYYSYQPMVASLVDEHPIFTMIYGPSWLHLGRNGILSGISENISAVETVILRAEDSHHNFDFQTFNISITESVEDSAGSIFAGSELSIYHNPVSSNSVTINFSPSPFSSTLYLFDLLGREISRKEIFPNDHKVVIETTFLPDGVYFVQISSQLAHFTREK